MRIESFEVLPISIPRSDSLSTGGTENSTSGSRSSNHIITRIETQSGIKGYGEVAPHPDWPKSGTQASIQTILEEEYSHIIEGESVFNVRKILEKLRREVASQPFAIAGVDMALHDCMGKLLEKPLYSLIGGPTMENRELKLHHTVGIKEIQDIRDEVSNAAENGFVDFKMKVGAENIHDDCQRLETVQDACEGAKIRIDANGSWQTGEAIRNINLINKIADNLVFVEQPVDPRNTGGLKRVQSTVEPPVIADESCYSPEDVAAFASENIYDGVNMKIAKSGGIAKAKEFVSVAAAHRLPCLVGGMLESSIGTAATLHLAVTMFEQAFPTGVLNIPLEEPIIKNSSEWKRDGAIFSVPEKDGLGVTVDTEVLESYRIN